MWLKLGAVVAEASVLETLADWGDVPGVTINRFCASGIDAVAVLVERIAS